MKKRSIIFVITLALGSLFFIFQELIIADLQKRGVFDDPEAAFFWLIDLVKRSIGHPLVWLVSAFISGYIFRGFSEWVLSSGTAKEDIYYDLGTSCSNLASELRDARNGIGIRHEGDKQKLESEFNILLIKLRENKIKVPNFSDDPNEKIEKYILYFEKIAPFLKENRAEKFM